MEKSTPKFNGLPFSKLSNGMQLYKVVLKGGPADKHPTLCSYRVSHVVFNGERYELNQDGDYAYAPEGLN
jgi:hypothetical protein